MRHRYGGRLAGVLALAGAVLAVGAGPARGADRDSPVRAAFPDVTVPVGGAAVDPLGPSLWSTTGPMTLTGVTVSYHLTGARGVTISPSSIGGGTCTSPSARRIVCTDPRKLSFEGETIEQYLPVDVRAAASAQPGSTGAVTITVAADGLTPIVGTSHVRVTGSRDGLPVTGLPAGPLGGIGLLLLGAGVAGVLSARRHRVPPA